jgi:ribose transport system permease protein
LANKGAVKKAVTKERPSFHIAWDKLALPLVAVVLFAIFGIASGGTFLNFQNLVNVARQFSPLGIAAVGSSIVIISGGFDISVGSVVGLVSVATAIIMKSTGSVSIGIVAGLLVGAVCGLVSGIMVTRFAIVSIIATLAMASVAHGLSLIITNGMPVLNVPYSFSKLGNGYFGFIPIPVIITVAIFIFFHLLLTRTRFGRYIYAVGSNQHAALLSGIKVKQIQLMAYVIAATLSATSSVITSSRIVSGDPTLGTGLELQAIAASVIGGVAISGGVGSLGGTAFGVIIMAIVSNGLNLAEVSSYTQEVVVGVIIAMAVGIDVIKTPQIITGFGGTGLRGNKK